MLPDALVLIAVGAFAAILPRGQAYRRYLTRQISSTVLAEQRVTLESRVSRRATGMGAGVLVAGLLVLVVDRLWETPESMTGLGLILSLMFVFGAAGSAVVEKGTLLLARSQWFDTATILWSPVSVIAIAIPVLVVLTSLAVRRVLDTPQPARDKCELYWHDAVRAQALLSLVAPTPLVAIFGLALCGSVLDAAASLAAVAQGAVGPGWSLAILLAGYGVPIVLVVLGLLMMADPWGTPPARHFRDRLWGGQPPALASEQVNA